MFEIFLQVCDVANESDISSIAKKLKQAHDEYSFKTKMYEEYAEHFSRTNREIQLKQQGLEAFHVAVTMFEDQILLMEHFQKQAESSKMQNAEDNSKLLKQQLKMLKENKWQLEEQLKQQRAYSHTLECEILLLKPEITHAIKLKEKYQG